MEVFRDAFNYDPIYKAIESRTLANQEAYPQARAELLPSLIATASVSQNHAFQKLFHTDPTNYGSHTYLVTLDQPVFDYTKIKSFKRSKAIVKQEAATLVAAQQDLMVRTAAAYFNVLVAIDNLHFVQAQKIAIGRQLDLAKQRFQIGLDTKTSVYDAQASYDGVVSQEISYQNDVINQNENLRKITGRLYPELSPLKPSMPLLPPNPTQVERWVESATLYNNTLRAVRYSADAARENIGVATGGALPTLNLVTNYINNNPIRGSFTGHDNASAGVGVALEFPVFQGGLVLSQIRQAKFNYAASLSDVEASFRNATVSVRQFYNDVITGISVIKADRQTVISATSSVESNEASYRVGTATIVDLLLAQNKLYNSLRQLASDQYSYINSILALKNAAGTLSPIDLAEVNTWLDHRTVSIKHQRT